jgi:outer membrane protein assembly factor BamB
MRMTTRRASLMALSLSLALVAPMRASDADGQAYWPQWRGPFATGASDRADPPLEWSETKNVKWKVEIPGRGSASPIVWGDRIFLLTAVPKDTDPAAAHQPLGGVKPRAVHRYVVLALDRKSGKTVWEQTAREAAPSEGAHQDNGTWASSSAVTDGEHVIASFESQGIYAYDMSGKPVWQKDLGDKRMRNEFGEGSTPTLHGRYLVVSGTTRANPSSWRSTSAPAMRSGA